MTPDDTPLLTAIRHKPTDHLARLAYADWLEERGDPRAEFLRLHLGLLYLGADDLRRLPAETQLSALRSRAAADWLAVIEPQRAPRPACECLRASADPNAPKRPTEPRFHHETQDTESAGWKRLCELVEQAAADGRAEFAPRRGMPHVEWEQVITLPPTISKLKSVEVLDLYGSHLVRIPPEIGGMSSLKDFSPYTSYQLHWFPYEITRCQQLKDSTVSTRALYGNFKHRTPFPQLDRHVVGGEAIPREILETSLFRSEVRRPCSVCNQTYTDEGRFRVWLSLAVATDVLPLLVNACSPDCLARLPPGAPDHVERWHRGGLSIAQPES